MAEEIKKIEAIIHRTADSSSNGDLSKELVFVFPEGQMPEKLVFDDEIAANEHIAQLLKETGSTVATMKYDPKLDPKQDAEVLKYIQQQYITYTQPSPTQDDNKDDDQTQTYKPRITKRGEEVFKTHPKLKKVAAYAGAAIVIAGAAVGVSHIINSAASQTSTVKNNATETNLDKITIDEIMDKLEDGSLAKKEYQKALSFCDSFNKLASESGNFRMSADGENYLEITAEEALYTSIVLNGYSETQIREIFGAREIDSADVIKGFESVCEKVRIYSMNATSHTGIDKLIEDTNASNFFFGTENAVMEFNRSIGGDNLNPQYSDKVLETVKNNFSDATTINPAVAHLTSMLVDGYANANVNNPSFMTYGGTLEGATGIAVGETTSDIIEQIDSKDYLSSVKANLDATLSTHNAKIAAELSENKTKLTEALKSNGDTALATEVATKIDLSDLEDKITSKGGDIADLYKSYQEKVDTMNPAGIPSDAIISKIDQTVTSGKTCDLTKLANNRVRDVYEKTNEEIVDNSNTQTPDTNTPSTETEEEIIIEDNNAFIDQTVDGIDAAIDYVNTPGAYKYDGTIQNKYMDVPYTDEELAQMTPSQIWKEMHMAGLEMPSVETDEQLQEYIENASQGKADSFEEGLTTQLNAEISISEELANDTMKDYANMYNEAQNSVDQLNQSNDTTYVQGDNLTQEQAGATATVVTNDVEVLDFNTTYATAEASFDADINQAAAELIVANADYYGYDSYTNTDGVKTK